MAKQDMFKSGTFDIEALREAGAIRDYEQVEQISVETAEAMAPRVLSKLREVLSEFKLSGLIPTYFTLPAIYLMDTNTYRPYLAVATKESNSPHNENRGFSSYEASRNAIYVDIEAGEALDDGAVVEAFREEILHYLTVSNGEDGTRVGFVRLGMDARPYNIPSGFYSYSTDNISDNDIIGFVEIPEEICATELLTRAAVLMFGKKSILCFTDTAENLGSALLVPIHKESINRLFKDVTGFPFVKALVDCMKAGNLDAIETKLIAPLEKIIKKRGFTDPQHQLVQLIEFLRGPVKSKEAMVVELDLNEQ